MDFNGASSSAWPYGPFGMCRGPGWRKVGRGLISVTDGSAKQYVAPGLVFGIGFSDEGTPEFRCYWRDSGDDGMLKQLYNRPYTLRTIRRLVAERQMVKFDTIDYDELVHRVRTVHSNCRIPQQEMFAMEYGGYEQAKRDYSAGNKED